MSRKLRIGLPRNGFMPYRNNCSLSYGLRPGKHCPFPGIGLEVLGWLCAVANVEYELVELTSGIVGLYNQSVDRWTGMLGHIESGLVDTVGDTFMVADNGISDFKWTHPILNDDVSIISPIVVEQTVSDWLTDTRIWRMFTLNLWMLMAASVVTLVVVRKAADRIARDTPIHKTVHVLLSFTLIVFFGIYRGRLMAALMTPINVQRYESLQDLVDGLNGRQIALAVKVNDEVWYHAETDGGDGDTSAHIGPMFEQLYQALANNPPIRSRSIHDQATMTSNGKAVFIHSYTYGRYISKLYCNLQVYPIDLGKGTGKAAFAFSRHSKHDLFIDRTIRKLNDAIAMWHSEIREIVERNVDGIYGRHGFVAAVAPYCEWTTRQTTTLTTSLSLREFASLILTVLTGFMASVLVFGFEYHKR